MYYELIVDVGICAKRKRRNGIARQVVVGELNGRRRRGRSARDGRGPQFRGRIAEQHRLQHIKLHIGNELIAQPNGYIRVRAAGHVALVVIQIQRRSWRCFRRQSFAGRHRQDTWVGDKERLRSELVVGHHLLGNDRLRVELP